MFSEFLIIMFRERTAIIFSFFFLCCILLFSCLTPSILVTREQNTGDDLFNRHRYDEAVVHYEKMLEESQKLGIYRNLQMEASVCRKVANCYEMTGKYSDALEYVERAMKLDSAAGYLLGRIEDYRHRGKIYIYMGQYYNGISSLERALELSEGMNQSLKNENRLTIADNYLALGQLYAVMGKTETSLKYTDRALTIFRQAGEMRGEMEAYLTLASVYSDQGDLITASRFAENSLKLAERLGLGTARHYHLMATIASGTGDYEKALRYQEKALEEAKKTRIAAQIIWATVGMGDIYSELGDYRHAGQYYRQAREQRDTIGIMAGSLDASIGMRLGDVAGASRYYSSEGSVTGNAITSLRMAELLMNAGKPDSAFYYLSIAGSAFHSIGNRQGLSNTYLLKGKILNDAGNYSMALAVIDSALRFSEFPDIKWRAWFERGRVYENSGDDARAVMAYRNAIDIIEKIRGNLTVDEFRSIFLENKREVYDRLIRLLMKNRMPDEAFRISEQARARAFYDILAGKKIDFRGALPGDLVTREQEKRLELQNLYRLLQRSDAEFQGSIAGRASEMPKVMEELTRVQTEYEELLRMLKLNNPAYAEVIAAEPVTIEDVQSELNEKTALISYWVSEDGLSIWLIKPSGTEGFQVKTSYGRLYELIELARKSISSNDDKAANYSLKELYNLLIYPVEKHLEGFRDIVFIPNGPLHFLPFQALKDRNDRYLIDKYNITYSPSASVYTVCNERPVPGGSKFLGVALSDMPIGGKPGLPGTEDELKNILPLFSESLSATGKNATETFVKRNAGSCSILHLATHGTYNYNQPLYSCLLFPATDEDDGRLNVWEVLEMKLNAKLVTLSACETGLGNVTRGDEMTGLSRAFLFAGSPSVVVSLWAVADYPTSFLMSAFYRNLKSYPASEALSLAQRETMKKYPQPLYWAPFVLIGNGNVKAE